MALTGQMSREAAEADTTPATKGFVVFMTYMLSDAISESVKERFAKLEARIAELEEQVTRP